MIIQTTSKGIKDIAEILSDLNMVNGDTVVFLTDGKLIAFTVES